MRNKLIIWGVIAVLVIAFLVFFFKTFNYDSLQPKVIGPGGRKTMAKYMAEKFMSDKLKAPSTAEYNPDPDISYDGDETYDVASWVDSQNSFGAKLRMKFRAKLKYDYTETGTDKEHWILLDLKEIR